MATTELGAVTMSPDGRAIVYVAGRGNTTQLMVRALDSGTARPHAGDLWRGQPILLARWRMDRILRRRQVEEGAGRRRHADRDLRCAGWARRQLEQQGTIVFAAATGGPLQQVSADGGTPARATELDVSRGEFSHRWPEFLPDGETVLFTVGTVGEWSEAEIVAQSIGSRERATVLKGGTNPRYLASGHLAYAHDGAIWVAPFDARSRCDQRHADARARRRHHVGRRRRAVRGFTRGRVGISSRACRGRRAGSSSSMPRRKHPLRRRLTRTCRRGCRPMGSGYCSVSPTTASIVWSYDLSAGTLTQLTFDAANRAPIWSHDGQRVIFASNRNGALNLFSLPAGGDGSAERLTTTESLQLPGSWSPDGETLAFMEQHPSTGPRHLAAAAQRRSRAVCRQRSGRKRAALLAGRPMDRVCLE